MIPFCGMTTVPRSRLTNLRLKPSVAKNLKDPLVHSSLPQVLQRQIGTFPCNRRDCRTFPLINSSDRITTTQGQIKISGFFTCITSQLVYCISCRKCRGVVYIGETGRRLGARFREHRLDVIKKKVALPELEDMQVAVIRAGLPEQDKRRREEMRFIHNFGTLAQGQLNRDFSFTWLVRAPTRFVFTWLAPTHTRLLLRAHFQIFKFSAITNSHLFPDEGSIAETSEFYLQLTALNLPPSHF